jgi:predicted nucleic acid-binding protein
VKDYVLDANGVLRYFQPKGMRGAEEIESLLAKCERGEIRLWISAINLGEVYYILLRAMKDHLALDYIQALRRTVLIHEPDADHALAAARLKHRYKLGNADSFAAALALEKGATLVSADPEFERLGKALKWKKLPRFRG